MEVARGYLGLPGLTAGKFVPDAFGKEPGGRLYRTGDRVRWLGSGHLEFLGRVDAQVKVRGYRIEPGEVEAVLAGLPCVREAVVIAREDAPGENRLVAYVVAEEGGDSTGAVLREQLAARLPEYMVPGAFVRLERLPLNANGKVDRRALPAPEQGAGAAYVAPRTVTEVVLAGDLGGGARLGRVGVEEDFFELGGHSLLAMQVVSRARLAFGVEVPLRALFEAPTVAGLARRVEAVRGAGTTPAPSIERVSRTEPLPLSFAQQRLWVVDRLEPGNAAYNMPVALRLRGALDAARCGPAWTRWCAARDAAHHVRRAGRRPVQVVHPPAPCALPVARPARRAGRGAEAERLAARRRCAVRPGARDRCCGARCCAWRRTTTCCCFTLHHVVSDGWSMDVLVREVSALYAAFGRGETPRLPELPVQYADFAVWQREWLRGGTLEAQIGSGRRGSPARPRCWRSRPTGRAAGRAARTRRGSRCRCGRRPRARCGRSPGARGRRCS
jgi:acyl carrier protein